MDNTQAIIKQQMEYYRARAAEYDEWVLRQGRYDRGEEHRRQWRQELEVAEAELNASLHPGSVLELACGTGLWTACLARKATKMTAVDSSKEAMDLNRKKTGMPNIEYLEADIFTWKPKERYDFIFFGFWLSHVPAEKFHDFWGMISEALTPDGKVFFVDNLITQESRAKDHVPVDNSGIAERKLNDGRRFSIVKIFYEPGELLQTMEKMGWEGKIGKTGKFFLFGCIRKKTVQ